MNVGLIGFGKTGKAVASVLLSDPGIKLRWVLRQSLQLHHRSVAEYLGVTPNGQGLIYSTHELSISDFLDKQSVDVIVDFSSSNGIFLYGEEAKRRGITVISAVSKYSHDILAYLKHISQHTKVLHSPNITLGVNFLLVASKILKNIAPAADIEIIEEHFKHKQEVSGTAKIIAKNLELEEDTIKTIRAGGIIGVHEILFGFPYQIVRLKHESIAREAFGDGILFAINNLPSEKFGLLSMEDLLMPYFQLNSNEAEYKQKKYHTLVKTLVDNL